MSLHRYLSIKGEPNSLRNCVLTLILGVVLLMPLHNNAHAKPRTGHMQLSISEEGVIWRDGTNILSQSPTIPVIDVYYSDEPDIWKARTWVKLIPHSVKITRNKKSILIYIHSFGGKPIQGLVTATPNQETREIVWKITLWNHTKGTVVGLTVPPMLGIENLPDGSLYFPDRPGQMLKDPWDKLASASFQLGYPVPASMQYLIYAGLNDGVAFDVLDKSMSYKVFEFGGPDREFAATLYPFIPPGHKWVSPDILWQDLRGDWHVAARRYRAWYDSWAKTPQISSEVRKDPVMGGIVVLARPVKDPNLNDVTKDMETGTYAAALEKARQLHEAGFEGAHLVGWFGQGHDSTYPDYYPTARMGGGKGLVALVDGMHAMHMLATFYLNARLGNVTDPTYLAHPGWAVELADGQHVTETYGETFNVLCPAAKGFQTDIIDTVKRIAMDYHGDGVQLDQVGAAQSFLCFDRAHGHSTPATAWAQGYTEMLTGVRSAARKIDPDFWDWIEGAWEGAGQYVDLSQGGFWQAMPDAIYFPQMYRYTIPQDPMFGDARMGGVPYWCPTDIQRAKKIDDAVSPIFWHGEFMDNIGLSSSPQTEVHWFRYKGQVVITVVNNNDASQDFDVRLELSQLNWKGFPSRAQALASGRYVQITRGDGYLSFTVSVPAKQVEAVLIR